MNLFIYTGASRLNAAVVESATDLTPVSRLPDLIVGDSEPVTVKFLSASGAYESWSGGGTYTLSISIGALGGDGIAAYFQTSSFTAVTNGWTGRLNLASGSLPSVVAGYLAERPGAQSVPLFVQVRVTDADGNTETYARQAVSVSGAVSVPTTANSTPVTYATAADVAADAATASAAAIAAAASASAASGSASTAAGHVTTAGNSATAAAASAVTAGNSATTASGHATTATTQATNAATSSSNASTYKDAAAVSAASATSSAGTATTQAALATTNGAAQVTLATTQATNASASATAAGISAAAALVSEAAALVSKNAAAASAATASAVSGSGNGTFSAAALTGVNSITASASTALTITGGSTGASLVLGQGTTAADVTVTPKGTGIAVISGPLVVGASSSAIQAAWTGAGYAGRIMFPDSSNFSLFSEPNALYRGGGMLTNIARVGGSWGFVDSTKPAWRVYFGNGALSDNFSIFRSASTTYSESSLLQLTSTGNLLIGTTTDAASLAGGLVVNGSGAGAAASSTTTGALRVTGGVGVSGAGYFGGSVNGADALRVLTSGTPIGSFQSAAGDLYISLDQNANGNMIFRRNSGTEAMRITGSNGAINITSTVSASSATTGALTIGNGSAATNVAIGGGNVWAGAAILADSYISAGSHFNAPATGDFRLGATYARVAKGDGVGGFVGGYNVTFNSGVKHDSTGAIAATYYATSTGINWYSATSQVAGTAATPAMTLAMTGVLSIASTSPSTGLGSGALQVAGGIYAGADSYFSGKLTQAISAGTIAQSIVHTSLTAGVYQEWKTNTTTDRAYIGTANQVISGGSIADFAINSVTGNVVLGTASAARLTIGSAAATFAGAVTALQLNSLDDAANNRPAAIIRAQNSTTYSSSVLSVQGDRTTTNATYNLIVAQNAAVTGQFIVRDSGNVLNTNNSYGAISDRKLKENITDTAPKLAQLARVQIRDYNLIGKAETQTGVIAQELEEVFPSLVESFIDRDAAGNDLGTVTKTVKYSQLVPLLVKALQELRADFEAYKATHP